MKTEAFETSNEYPQHTFSLRNKKNINILKYLDTPSDLELCELLILGSPGDGHVNRGGHCDGYTKTTSLEL